MKMRCFVALLPPVETARQLDRWIDSISAAMPGARRVAAANLHLTLAFIGSLPAIDAHALAAALRVIDEAAFPSFTWTLDRVGRFDRARVLWVGGGPNPVLDRYADTVRSMLRRSGVPFDSKPFVSHVTVLRTVRSGAPLPELRDPIRWPMSRPQLMQSLHGTAGLKYAAVE